MQRLDVHTVTFVAQLVQFRSSIGLAALHASVTEVVQWHFIFGPNHEITRVTAALRMRMVLNDGRKTRPSDVVLCGSGGDSNGGLFFQTEPRNI